MFTAPEYAEAGGLMSYGENPADRWRRLATYVDKILKGTKPADLPVEAALKFEFIVNLKAAKQIGLTMPPNVLARALFFDGIHFLISGTALRAKIVGLIGERLFQGLFSLMSLIGIVWLSRAYGQAEYLQLWAEPRTLRPFALIMMLFAFFFVVLAFTAPNPTAVGVELY
jgi:NnrU protein/ABC transporter substrate binding protein